MIRLDPREVQVRQHITRHFVQYGHAPMRARLAETLGVGEDEIGALLESLAAKRGLVLHPHNGEVWIAHPFSNAPAGVWIHAEDGRGWWAPCIWCGLGVAALVKEPVMLSARIGGEEEFVSIRAREGQIEPGHLVVHMPTPMFSLWHNVVYSCQLMLPFHGADQIARWSERHQLPRGPALPIQKCWELAQGWYGAYLDPDWNRKDEGEVRAFLGSLGINPDFSLR